MKFLALLAVMATGGLLIYGVTDFPAWGSAQSPANAGVPGAGPSISQLYITETENLTKVPNIVTAVLADYRSFDTLVETLVIFAAGIAVIAILRVNHPVASQHPGETAERHNWEDADHLRIIIGTTCRLIIPIIQIFALYVVAHGHHSPGGGFQGGVILGASFILWGLATNLETSLKWLPEKRFLALSCIGLLIYFGFGWLPQLLGRNFLDYGALKYLFGSGEEMARSHSMLGIEIGVAFTVTAIMFAIYANLASKGELKKGL